MTLEQAIAQANDLVARQQQNGADSVTDAEIMEALDQLRTARAASATKTTTRKAPAAPVNLEDIF